MRASGGLSGRPRAPPAAAAVRPLRPGPVLSNRHLRPCRAAAAADGDAVGGAAGAEAGEAALRAYLEGEAGLKSYQADRLLRELGKQPGSDLPWLRERIEALAAGLGPGGEAHVAAAAYNGGLELLQADAGAFKQQLAALKEALPGVNVLDVVAREPRLLFATPNVGPVVKKVITKLTNIYPYKSPNKKQDVIQLVYEYPELLVRMQHYAEDKGIKRVQDLPVDLQNRILKSYC